MDIFELKTRFPKTYQEAFNRVVRAERAKHLGADLIANAEPDEVHPAVFTATSVCTARWDTRRRVSMKQSLNE